MPSLSENDSMTIQHLPADSAKEKISEIIDRDGSVIIDNVLDRATIDAINSEISPHLEAAEKGSDAFDGYQTKRMGSLVARSPSSHQVIMNPIILDAAAHTLHHGTTYQLHVTEVISIGPNSEPQDIHRDQWAFDMFTFPQDFEVVLATMWALTDFTEENGATRVVPGSHKMKDKLKFKMEDSVPAEMKAGSVLLYTGSAYHGGGRNSSQMTRTGLIFHYSLGWLRQEENQYLSVPAEILQTLPEDLLRLMGYQHGAYSLGFIDGGRDPIAAIRPELERSDSGISYDDIVEDIDLQTKQNNNR
jgi:ectoine hydroxylase-related dioxygenase (phytanoyl-CoA dioxygenase family)